MVWKRTQIKSSIPRYHEINPLGPAFVYCLDSKVNGPLVSLRISGACFDFVPARLGHNVALDDAVSCMCAIYCRRPSISYTADREIYQSYVKALSSLRGYLSDASLRLEAETLCASILLQMCEVRTASSMAGWELWVTDCKQLVVSTGRGDWGSLARGTSALLSSRGVQRYSSEFELAMLECQLPHVVRLLCQRSLQWLLRIEIVRPIFEVERALFLEFPGMADVATAGSSLAVSYDASFFTELADSSHDHSVGYAEPSFLSLQSRRR